MLLVNKIISKLTLTMLCAAILLSVPLTAFAHGEMIAPLPGNVNNIENTPTESGDGWPRRRLDLWYSNGDNSGSYRFDALNPTKPLKPNPKPEPDSGGTSGTKFCGGCGNKL